MDPIKVTDNLLQSFVDYLSTTFNVNRDGQESDLQAAINASFEAPQALQRGPYLEITPPYKRGASIDSLCADGILSDQWATLPEDNLPIPLKAQLYTHQEQAIRNYYNGNSTVISSGTGSGKTESFLIPILDNLLQDKQPGVRAVLIYPMNALVNDQLDRLRRLLKGSDITFGRYTSELESTEEYGRTDETLPNEVVSRETIRNGSLIPQILITNYAMLEYLLLRPEDSPLFESGAWRFLVLDEAHTYAGAQGTEVAYLIRRLKHRLGKKPGDMICFATSATLTEDRSVAQKFAEDLFDEPFSEDDIIVGEEDDVYIPSVEASDIDPQAYLDERLNVVFEAIENDDYNLEDIASQLAEIGIITPEYSNPLPDHKTVEDFLWDALQSNPHLIQLRTRTNEKNTYEITSIANKLFGNDLPSHKDRLRALYTLIDLGTRARPAPDRASMLSARYHVFMRPPQGIWVCLNPHCNGREEDSDHGWSRIFATKRERCDACDARVYPLVACRECGQVYVRTTLAEDHHHYAESPYGDSSARYLLWKHPHANYALADEEYEDEAEELAEESDAKSLKATELTICIKCGRNAPRSNCCDQPIHIDVQVIKKEETRRGTVRREEVNLLEECIRCGSKSISGTEIATPVSVSGATPLSILTNELYRELPETSDKPGNGRKLLTFYDSRQGAARFAAFLQDVTNQQHYDHIVPNAIYAFEDENNYSPDIDSVTEQAIQIGWDERLYHNDEKLKEGLRLDRKRPSQNDRRKLQQLWHTILLSEFTTRRKRRQSLESLGVVGVKYFEDEAEFDVADLAPQLGIPEQATRTLIEFFLDDIRYRKAIAFPDSVNIDDERFGRNISNPKLVRGGAQRGEIPWIGKTERHRRNRYMQKVLTQFGLPNTFEDVKTKLGLIWEWMIQCEDLFTGDASSGYQLSYTSIYLSSALNWSQCQQCFRVYARDNTLPCPHSRCDGALEPVTIETVREDNYFFKNMTRKIVPMRVEEHTAQLNSDKGRVYQDKFRNGDINVLSCSTTFEMGIDLGDLQSVVMSNIPPTVANYRQRSGRAGRRVDGAAFILTWADERPHDQAYFKDPIQIIEGSVKVPHIALDNDIIKQRHINAMLISAFLRFRKSQGYADLRQVESFFDPNSEDRHYDAIDEWLNSHASSVHSLLERFLPTSNSDQQSERIEGFQDAVSKLNEQYQKRSTFYRQQIDSGSMLSYAKLSPAKMKEKLEKSQEYIQLLQRLNSENLINFMSEKGVLPSYSFPLHTVELILPKKNQDKGLRLQRDLKQAIREYAPGAEIVADKRIWRSAGVRFYHNDAVRSREYSICEYCNYMQISDFDGQPLNLERAECPACGEKPNRRQRPIKQFVTPDDFFAGGKENNQVAGQYVKRLKADMRSALIPSQAVIDRETINEFIEYTYERNGELLYANEGEYGKGFNISLSGENVGQIRKEAAPVSLGHIQKTDVLHLYFKGDSYVSIPDLHDRKFWLSIMYALIQGACRALQIERGDIDGVLSPQSNAPGDWEQAIVLYDNVPGGAGHVRHIERDFSLVSIHM